MRALESIYDRLESPADRLLRRGGSQSSYVELTMSLFIAGQTFPAEADFAAAKIAVFAGSVLSAIIGTALLLPAREGQS